MATFKRRPAGFKRVQAVRALPPWPVRFVRAGALLCAALAIGLWTGTAHAASDAAASSASQRIDEAHKRTETRTPFKAKDAHIDDDTVNEPWIVSALMVGGLEHDIVGACSAPCDKIEMQVSDPQGKPLVVDATEAPFAIFTFTPPLDGHYKIRLRAMNCPPPARACPVAYTVFRARDASAQPAIAVSQTPVTTDQNRQTLELSLAMRTELSRLGCDSGRQGEGWNAAAKGAMRDFVRITKLDLATDAPSPDGLSALRSRRDRVCPLKCGDGERVTNGHCTTQRAEADDDRPAKRPPAKQAREQPRETARVAPKTNAGDASCSKLKSILAEPGIRGLLGC